MTNKLSIPAISSYILTGLAAIAVIKAGLIIALFSGLLVYSLVHLITPKLEKRIKIPKARLFVLALLAIFISSGIAALIFGIVSYAKSEAGSMHFLFGHLATIIDASRSQIPAWLNDYLPYGGDALRDVLTGWLREHAVEAQLIGQEAGHSIVYLFLGMIIGGMIAAHEGHQTIPPFAQELQKRAINLHKAFQKIVFAQVRISLINTLLSGVDLLIVLPLTGVNLPFSKTLIIITFVAGLLPVAGNIMSNTVIVIISLSHSIHVAAESLLYLVLIHKLEYFLNAKIVGNQINAHAWELLTAILVMEALFGLPGLVAAPVYYAYLKLELGMGCFEL